MAASPGGIVRVGEWPPVIERKRFAEGRTRAIHGTVEATSGDLVRLHGWQGVYREVPPGHVRNHQAVTIVLRLDNDILAVVLPDDCRVTDPGITLRGNYLTITDGADFEFVDPLHAPDG